MASSRNKPRKLPWRPRLPVQTQRVLRELIEQGFTAPDQIAGECERLARQGKLERVPDRRTIASFVRHHAVPDTSGAWSLASDQTGRPDLLLPVALAVAERTGGRVRLTHDLAAWIVKIASAAPGIAPWEAYRFARRYQAMAAHGQDTYPLDLQVACEAWTLPGRQRWDRLVARTGWEEAARAAVVAVHGPEAVEEGGSDATT